MKFKIDNNWLNGGLLIVIILELLALLVVKLMYMPFNKADFHNITMPIISAAGFIAVIVSIWYVKKGNDERLSQEYYNFYIEKIEKYKQRMNDEKLAKHVQSIEIAQMHNIHDFRIGFFLLSYKIIGNPDYNDDLKKFKNGEKLEFKYIENRSYVKSLREMIRLAEVVTAYSRSNNRLLREIKGHRKLSDDHIELLSRPILSELFKEYLIACKNIYKTAEGEIINLFLTDKESKVIDSLFFHIYDIIRKDDTLKNLLSSEGIRID